MIRNECLRPANAWEHPTQEEIREAVTLTGLSGAQISERLGLADSRSIRRWISKPESMPYAVWALLCNFAGFGCIWRNEKD